MSASFCFMPPERWPAALCWKGCMRVTPSRRSISGSPSAAGSPNRSESNGSHRGPGRRGKEDYHDQDQAGACWEAAQGEAGTATSPGCPGCPATDVAKPNVQVLRTTTPPLDTAKSGVATVAMASTHVYWIPMYELLESRRFEVVLANARQLSQVPGRKKDLLDCGALAHQGYRPQPQRRPLAVAELHDLVPKYSQLPERARHRLRRPMARPTVYTEVLSGRIL